MTRNSGAQRSPQRSQECESEVRPCRSTSGGASSGPHSATASFRPLTSTKYSRSATSHPQRREEALAVRARAAQQELGALRPPEVEVRGVLPGEADAAVDLDVLGRDAEVGLRAERLGDGRDARQVRVVAV